MTMYYKKHIYFILSTIFFDENLKRSSLLETSFCFVCGGQLNPGMKLYIGITSILNPHTHTSGQAFLLLPPPLSYRSLQHPCLFLMCHWSAETDVQISWFIAEIYLGLGSSFSISLSLEFLPWQKNCHCRRWSFRKTFIEKFFFVLDWLISFRHYPCCFNFKESSRLTLSKKWIEKTLVIT